MTENKESVKAPNKARILLLIFLVILPIINYFIIDYFEAYTYNDIMKEAVNDVLYYTSTVIGAILPYITFGCGIFFCFRYEGKRRAGWLALCFLSIFLPYVGGIISGMMLSSAFISNIVYYLLYTLLNYFIDSAILFAVLLFTMILKRYYIIKKKDLQTAALKCQIFAPVPLLIAEFIEYTVNVVKFIYSLNHEYYDTMTTEELVTIIVNYLEIIAKGVGGFLIVMFIFRILSHISKQENN